MKINIKETKKSGLTTNSISLMTARSMVKERKLDTYIHNQQFAIKHTQPTIAERG
jgi:hypothetical protein